MCIHIFQLASHLANQIDMRKAYRPLSSQSVDRSLMIGIDAGGSKCGARLCNCAGQVLAEVQSGPANAHTDPWGAWKAIFSAFEGALSRAGRTPDALGDLIAGIGVAGIDPLDPVPPPWPLDVLASHRIDSDVTIAHLGAHGGAAGGVLIVGTGSIGLAVVDGHRTVVGGQGPDISDEGSGAWIGREAVRRTLWVLDGRSPRSSLAEHIAPIIGGTSGAADWAKGARPADYARLAPKVIEAAEENDQAARTIILEATQHLSSMARRLTAAGAEKLCILGGLAFFFAPKLATLGLPIAEPKGDALDGALMLARGKVA